jgi:hypothetical protein
MKLIIYYIFNKNNNKIFDEIIFVNIESIMLFILDKYKSKISSERQSYNPPYER